MKLVNTVAYYDTATITAVKSFVIQALQDLKEITVVSRVKVFNEMSHVQFSEPPQH
jgi:hypothetical protein